jgi:beta-glucosidase
METSEKPRLTSNHIIDKISSSLTAYKIMASLIFILILSLSILSTSCSQTKNDSSIGNNGATIEQKVDDLLNKMTLQEKVGQMTQVDRAALQNIQDIKNYYLGSLLSGGGSAPQDNSPLGWANMYDNYQSYALQTRLKIPLIYGIDAVHGHNNVKGAVIFPHNIGMGCTWDTVLVRKAAEVTAEEVAGTGINWTFAPCIAVARNIRWGRTYESFGETPEIQQMMARAEVLGFQGTDLSSPGSILACAKHYVGDGGTEDGKDQGNTVCDEATLRAIHLPGYISAIKAGVGSIMVSYSSWNGLKMSQNKYLITDVLKTELGFKGFVVSDWGALYQLPGDFKTQIASAVNAGIDMVMVPTDYKGFISALTSDINDGSISMDRINDAVKRILTIKMEKGLFDHPYTDRTYSSQVGSAAHREVARECVRESLVLLKNDNNILPLKKNLSKIFVAGKNADDIGNQCGGWTISWQGSSGDITTGTTILQAIKDAVSPSTQVTFSEDGTGAAGSDVAIVVIGEIPYAEGAGDRTDLSISDQDYQTLLKVKNANIPTVVILISGRPMIISNILNLSDAIVAAWLPGTEGEGVTDVIFGDYKPVGKLTQSWPKSMDQIPINYGDTNYDPLFPYKFGLTY